MRTVEPIEPGSRHFDQAQAVRTLAALFEHVAQPDSLPQDSVREDYVSGIRQAHARDFDAALRALVKAVRKNRNYDDDGPSLGDEHEVTKKHRAALSNALF